MRVIVGQLIVDRGQLVVRSLVEGGGYAESQHARIEEALLVLQTAAARQTEVHEAEAAKALINAPIAKPGTIKRARKKLKDIAFTEVRAGEDSSTHGQQ